MARGAIRSQCPGMKGRVGMAGYAGGRSAFENTIPMAVLAARLCVRPFQREAGTGMVKRCSTPTLCGVAGCTVCAELPVVFIIVLVARVAIPGRAFE